jgi:DNA-directed RNA polymerase specialized sigma24 family protein
MSITPLSELLARIAAGARPRTPDYQEASQELVRSFSRLVEHVAYQHLPQWVLPVRNELDIAQDVWLRLFGGDLISRLLPRPHALPALLHKMTRNRVMKVVQRLTAGKRDRRLQTSLQEGSPDLQDRLIEPRLGPVQQVLPPDLCAAMCLGEDDTFRAIVEMKLAGFFLHEIAALLEIAVSKVKRAVERFRLRLSATLL